METIGNRISKYRRAKGLTQEELAGRLGVSSQAVSKWETDASCPDISLLPQLSKVLGITTDELLTGKSEVVRLAEPTERKSMEELTLRVKVSSREGDKIRINLPMPLVKIALEMGIEIAPQIQGADSAEVLKNLDMAKIVDMVELGLIGKLVEVESANGDTVEIVVE